MSDDENMPVYDGSIEKYLNYISRIASKRQKHLLNSAEEDCDYIAKSYWHTFGITGIVTFSSQPYHQKDQDLHWQYVKKWIGIRFRLQETLNILQDSMTLGFQGRTSSAFNLLRSALESIVTGVFYYFLSQNHYREIAHIVKHKTIGRNNHRFQDLVKEAIDSIEDKSEVPLRLESQIAGIASESQPPLILPTFREMTRQIAEWKLVGHSADETMNLLYRGFFNEFSTYTHSLFESTYVQSGTSAGNINLLLGWDIDLNAFQEYSRLFNLTCSTVLILYLSSTLELQTTSAFSKLFSIYLNKHPDVESVFGEITEQIKGLIKKSRKTNQ